MSLAKKNQVRRIPQKNHTGGLDGSEVHGDGKIFSSHDKLSGFFKYAGQPLL